jgi:hypothetical protein
MVLGFSMNHGGSILNNSSMLELTSVRPMKFEYMVLVNQYLKSSKGIG